MPHPIEIKARKFIQKRYPNVRPSPQKTFDLEIDGKLVEVKGKWVPFEKIDFISLTHKQYEAIGKVDFKIYLVTGLKTLKPQIYVIDPKKLKTIEPRKVVSYEYDRAKLRKII